MKNNVWNSKRSVVLLVALVGLIGFAGPSQALTVNFQGWEAGFNTPVSNDIVASNQFSVDITLAGDLLTFVVNNAAGGVPSSITEIYFYDTVDPTRLDFSAATLVGTGTAFTVGATPPNLPGQIEPVYDIDSNRATVNGINPGEILTVGNVGWSDSSWDIDDFANAFSDGTLMIGLHARGLGDQGNFSDWFITDKTVVPEPATMTLLGLGLAGLAFRRRKAGRLG